MELPHVLGTPKVGQVLTATTGNWTNSPNSFAYRWERCLGTAPVNCTTTVGTDPTYTVQSADAGLYLRVLVRAANVVAPSNGYYSSAIVGPVVAPVGPTAAATITPFSAAQGQTVTFDGSGSTAGDAPIVSWSWDFGDGSSDTGEIVFRQFAIQGSYPVTLTVVDANGLQSATLVFFEVGLLSPA